MLEKSRVYLILDTQVCSYDLLFEKAKEAILGGVDIIQLRDKNGSAKNIIHFSQKILKLTKGKVPYIMNDRVDLALMVHASGVHLGQDDVPLPAARKILGPRAMIGVSCQTLEQALTAQRQGADYIGFGSVFKTLTKPERAEMDLDLLKKIIEQIKIPVFGIGGITLRNLDQLTSLGLSRVAVCRAILESNDVGQVVRKFKRHLT